MASIPITWHRLPSGSPMTSTSPNPTLYLLASQEYLIQLITLLFIYFSFFIINFYWSIAALQCCVSFYCTAKWISYTSLLSLNTFLGFCDSTFSFLPLLPLWLFLLNLLCQLFLVYLVLKCWHTSEISPRPHISSQPTLSVSDFIHSHGFNNSLHTDNSWMYTASETSLLSTRPTYPVGYSTFPIQLSYRNHELNVSKTELVIFLSEMYFSTSVPSLSKQ